MLAYLPLRIVLLCCCSEVLAKSKAVVEQGEKNLTVRRVAGRVLCMWRELARPTTIDVVAAGGDAATPHLWPCNT